MNDVNCKYPEPPWSASDLLEVERLENERLIREFTEKLASVSRENDKLGGFFGNCLIARGAKHYRKQIESLRFRLAVIQEEQNSETNL